MSLILARFSRNLLHARQYAKFGSAGVKNSTKVSTPVNLHCNIEIQSHKPSSNKRLLWLSHPVQEESCHLPQVKGPPYRSHLLHTCRPTFMPKTKHIERLLVLIPILPPHQCFAHSSLMINFILQAAVIELSIPEGQNVYEQSP